MCLIFLGFLFVGPLVFLLYHWHFVVVGTAVLLPILVVAAAKWLELRLRLRRRLL